MSNETKCPFAAAHGVRANEHSRGLVAQDVTLADLFEA